MLKWFKDLDRILRGEATQLPALGKGELDIRAGGLFFVILILGMFYGLCMGCFALVTGRGGGHMQMVSAMVKVPMLFVLTLFVTFPSLYVFNALVGSRLTLTSVLRLLIAAMSVMLALLASFGTIVAFFSFTTDSYSFMVLLNVLVFAVSGFLGLTFLLRTLHRLTVAQFGPPPKPVYRTSYSVREEQDRIAAAALDPNAVPPVVGQTDSVRANSLDTIAEEAARGRAGSPEDAARPPSALDAMEGQRVSGDVKTVFRFWIIVFGLVGAQMSWVLRPFIGGGNEFALFRPRGANFFQAVLYHLQQLMGIKGGHW